MYHERIYCSAMCCWHCTGKSDPEAGTMDHAKLLNVTVAVAMYRGGLSFKVNLPADSTLTVVLDLE